MVIGHKKIINFLNKSIESDRVAHAYLFLGPEYVGKRDMALEFAKALQCESIKSVSHGLSFDHRFTSGKTAPPTPQVVGKTAADGRTFFCCDKCRSCVEIDKETHPDVLSVEPKAEETKGGIREAEIGIEQIRKVRQQLGLLPYRGPRKIVIIDRAERMTREAANAMLKTLEEPTKNTHLVLISSAQQSILPTIISRCLLVKFSLVSKKEIHDHFRPCGVNLTDGEIKRIMDFANGRPRLFKSYLENPEAVLSLEKTIGELGELLKKDLSFRFKYAENMSKDVKLANQNLSLWTLFFRDMLLSGLNCRNLMVQGEAFGRDEFEGVAAGHIKNILMKIKETKNILANSSFNARLALENLMLNL